MIIIMIMIIIIIIIIITVFRPLSNLAVINEKNLVTDFILPCHS